MMVTMELGATDAQIQAVRELMMQFGFKEVRVMPGDELIVIGGIGLLVRDA